MFVEIFNNRIYEETLSDVKNGVESKHVPYHYITEQDSKIRNAYCDIRDFLISMLDTEGYKLKNGGYYILTINHIGDDYSGEAGFEFAFDKIGEEKYSGTTTGEVSIVLSTRQIISFHRSFNGPVKIKPIEIPVARDYAGTWERSEGVGVDPSSIANPIQLSPNSFEVNEENTIEVACPELEIGKVADDVLTIDTKRQAAQDQFLRKMNSKFKKS